MPTFKLYAECIGSFMCVVQAPTLKAAIAAAGATPTWEREEPGEIGPIFAASNLDHGTAYSHTDILLALGGFQRTSDAATPAEHAAITLAAVKELLQASHGQPPEAQLHALREALARYARADDLAATPTKKRRRRKVAAQPNAQ